MESTKETKEAVKTHLAELKKDGKTTINRQIEAEFNLAVQDAYSGKPQPVYDYQGSFLLVRFPDYGKAEAVKETEAN